MELLGLPNEDERTLMVFPSVSVLHTYDACDQLVPHNGLARTLVYKDLARSPLPGQRTRRHPTIRYLFRFVSYSLVLFRYLLRCIVSSRFVSYVSVVS